MYSFTKAELKILLSVAFKPKGKKPPRPSLQQIAFDGRHAVATDGSRLLVCTFDARAEAVDAPLFCVSREAIEAACKAAKTKDTIEVRREGLGSSEGSVSLSSGVELDPHPRAEDAPTFPPWRTLLDTIDTSAGRIATDWCINPVFLDEIVKLGKLPLDGDERHNLVILAPKKDPERDPCLLTLTNRDQNSWIRVWQMMLMPVRR